MVLNSASIAELAAATNGPGAGGFDLAVHAQVGDTLEWGFNALLLNENAKVYLDVYTIVSAARVNPFGAGLSASAGSTLGVIGWSSQPSLYDKIVGSAHYVVVSGDIASGVVTCRPYYVQESAVNRTLGSSANILLEMWLKNIGPVAS